MKTLYFLWSLCFCLSVNGQVTFIIESLPNNHDQTKDIYIAGSFNNWSPSDENSKLTDGAITIQATQPVEYKFTLGSWDLVETTASGADVGNRKYDPASGKDTVLITIMGWKQTQDSKPLADNIILHNDFDIPQLNRTRDVWVCLPPNYDSESKNYPVLYMHDGQNLFDASLAFSGEWGVDETIEKLSKNHGMDLIAVGIANGGSYRITEYAPWVNAEYGGGEGEAYTEFLVETLKPFIDENYRTKTSSFHTGIMGSSLGANISIYAGLKHPDVFSRVGAMSPALWFHPELFDLNYQDPDKKIQKIYMNAGTREPASVTSNMLKLRRELIAESYAYSQIKASSTPNHGHNEAHWRSTLEQSLLWLFDDGQYSNVENGNSYAVHATDEDLTVFGDSASAIASLTIYNIVGQVKQVNSVILGESTDLNFDDSGLFVVDINDEFGKYSFRILK